MRRSAPTPSQTPVTAAKTDNDNAMSPLPSAHSLSHSVARPAAEADSHQSSDLHLRTAHHQQNRDHQHHHHQPHQQQKRPPRLQAPRSRWPAIDMLLVAGFVVFALCIASASSSSAVWQENVRPKLYVELGKFWFGWLQVMFLNSNYRIVANNTSHLVTLVLNGMLNVVCLQC